MKEINDDTNRWREIYHVLDRKHQYENDYTPQSNLQIQCNHCKLPMEFFTELEQTFLQFVWKQKKIPTLATSCEELTHWKRL